MRGAQPWRAKPLWNANVCGELVFLEALTPTTSAPRPKRQNTPRCIQCRMESVAGRFCYALPISRTDLGTARIGQSVDVSSVVRPPRSMSAEG